MPLLSASDSEYRIEDQKDDLDYEALSYAWGPEHDWASSRIRVYSRSRWRRRILKFSPALEMALRHLRRGDAARTLWIDAICINQADLQERGLQVRRMGDIYRRALRVVAWLGPQTDNSKLALNFLKHVKVVGMLSDGLGGFHWVERVEAFPFGGMPLEHAAFRDLIARPWFGRLWIRQEIILGSPASVVQCGHDEILWRQFKDHIYYFWEWKLIQILSSNDQDEIDYAFVLHLENLAYLCLRNWGPLERILESG
ncbi:heterokaryon incompatibility protein-domain-containing protein [Podospora didyma]|uniref:Heterokaryon incompatibility protein-domain-containing protein n=1 Tax=Podospora didyma TaxID=330526 RepID=A0AAE0NPN9_9PEZI|nr:heterokaryon incompatibility protein-domain-containing protein [Podospora didyma]